LLGWEYPQDYICCTGFKQLGAQCSGMPIARA